MLDSFTSLELFGLFSIMIFIVYIGNKLVETKKDISDIYAFTLKLKNFAMDDHYKLDYIDNSVLSIDRNMLNIQNTVNKIMEEIASLNQKKNNENEE